MIRVARDLGAAALISYLVLPMIKPLENWQSAVIMLCLTFVMIGFEMLNQPQAQAAPRRRADQRAATVDPQPASLGEAGDVIAMMQAVREAMRPTAPTPAPAPVVQPKTATPPKDAGFYELEAIALTTLLRNQYKMKATVHAAGMVKAPRFIAYEVSHDGRPDYEKLKKLEGDLARDINSLHRNHKFGDVQILFTDSQPIWLQISNPKPYPLKWSSRLDFAKLKPLQALLGVYYDGAVAKPLIIDIGGEDNAFTNGAWFGHPGAGKSTDMHAALCSMFEVTAPTDLLVWGIDISKDVFRHYQGLPHIAQYTKNIETALEILKMFANWCEAGNLKPDGIHRLLVIDECQDLLVHAKYGKAALELLDVILSKGREFGIRVWMATQNPDAKCYPSGLKPKTHFTACCCISIDNYVRAELGIQGASKIIEKEELIFTGAKFTGKRTSLLSSTGPRLNNQRVSMFYFSKQDRAEMIAGLISRWGVPSFDLPKARPVVMVTPVAPPPAATQPAPVIEIAPAAPVSRVVVEPEPEPVWEPVAVAAPSPVRVVAPAAPAQNPAHYRWNLTHRALTPQEGDLLIQMVRDADPDTEQFHYRGDPSINKIILHVYAETKNKEKIKWVKEHLIRGGLIPANDK